MNLSSTVGVSDFSIPLPELESSLIICGRIPNVAPLYKYDRFVCLIRTCSSTTDNNPIEAISMESSDSLVVGVFSNAKTGLAVEIHYLIKIRREIYGCDRRNNSYPTGGGL